MKKRFDYLNTVRVMAMLMVFLQHSFKALDWQNSEKGILLFTPAWAGVFIFFTISGYVIGKGFFDNRYEMSVKGIGRFYLKRFLRLGVSYYIFCFLVIVFMVIPRNEIPAMNIIIRLVTFRYNGNPGVYGLGAMWYVSTIVWLYFLAPLVFLLIRKIPEKFRAVLYAGIVVVGLGYRVGMYCMGADWYTKIYTSVYGNLDLFFGGFILAGIPSKPQRKYSVLSSVVSLFLLIMLIASNINIFYGGTSFSITVYRIIYPTAYLLCLSAGILLCNGAAAAIEEETVHTGIMHNAFWKSINWMSQYSLEFYFCHSLLIAVVLVLVPQVPDLQTLALFDGLVFVFSLVVSYLLNTMNSAINVKMQKGRSRK